MVKNMKYNYEWDTDNTVPHELYHELMRIFEITGKNELDFSYLCDDIREFFKPLEVDVSIKPREDDSYTLDVEIKEKSW